MWLARLTQIEDSRIEPIIQFIPHLAAVELAWHRGTAAAAKWHAAEVARYAEQSAVPYLSVVVLLCKGLAACSGGDFAVAEGHFLAALATAREGRVALDFEARLLALLAETYLRAGDKAHALPTAAEALATARRRTDRYAECQAAIIEVMALAVCDQTERLSEAAELLGRADQLIELTGAAVFRPMLERARLLVDTG